LIPKEEVEELIRRIPANRITTIDQVAAQLAKSHGTDVTCPMRTGNAIKKIADQYTLESVDADVPFWRVVRTNALMIKSKQRESWAALIEDEGFELDYTKSGDVKVKFDAEDVFLFE